MNAVDLAELAATEFATSVINEIAKKKKLSGMIVWVQLQLMERNIYHIINKFGFQKEMLVHQLWNLLVQRVIT